MLSDFTTIVCFSIVIVSFFFYLYAAPRDLPLLTHSFPPPRSSDLIFHQPLIVQMALAIDQHQPALSGSSSRGKTGWGGDNVNPDFARRSYDPMSESTFVFRSASGTPSWSSSLAADAGITGEIVLARSLMQVNSVASTTLIRP